MTVCHTELTGKGKSFLIKIIFFLALLTVVGFMYLESKIIIDAVYFMIVLVLFIRFLIVKLYQ